MITDVVTVTQLDENVKLCIKNLNSTTVTNIKSKTMEHNATTNFIASKRTAIQT